MLCSAKIDAFQHPFTIENEEQTLPKSLSFRKEQSWTRNVLRFWTEVMMMFCLSEDVFAFQAETEEFFHTFTAFDSFNTQKALLAVLDILLDVLFNTFFYKNS